MGLLGTMSAVGTALGPSLGGLLIAGFGWPAIFLGNVPLGVLALVLAYRSLPADGRRPTAGPAGFDYPGTLLLVWTLGTYAMAMTIGADRDGRLNRRAAGRGRRRPGPLRPRRGEGRVAADPVAILRDPGLDAGLITSALVSTVMMTTLVVGPFYLAQTLGLDPAALGLVMSAGPLVAALVGTPAGRAVDRFGRHPHGRRRADRVRWPAPSAWPRPPSGWGVPGYLAPLVVLTAGYALFQAANNTAVMAGASANDRGLVSGMANLSRNLGLDHRRIPDGRRLRLRRRHQRRHRGRARRTSRPARGGRSRSPRHSSRSGWPSRRESGALQYRGTARSGILDPRQQTDFPVGDRPRCRERTELMTRWRARPDGSTWGDFGPDDTPGPAQPGRPRAGPEGRRRGAGRHRVLPVAAAGPAGRYRAQPEPVPAGRCAPRCGRERSTSTATCPSPCPGPAT